MRLEKRKIKAKQKTIKTQKHRLLMIEVFTELGLNNLDFEKWMLPQLERRAFGVSTLRVHAPASLVPSAICRACSSDSAVLP